MRKIADRSALIALTAAPTIAQSKSGVEKPYIINCGEGVDPEKTLASMQRIADVIAKWHAQLWVDHDKARRHRLKMAPEFYE